MPLGPASLRSVSPKFTDGTCTYAARAGDQSESTNLGVNAANGALFLDVPLLSGEIGLLAAELIESTRAIDSNGLPELMLGFSSCCFLFLMDECVSRGKWPTVSSFNAAQ